MKEVILMEQSLYEKVGQMNSLGLNIALFLDTSESSYELLSDDDRETIYSVADGLAEEFVMTNIEGRCSLGSMLKNTPETLENYVDAKIQRLTMIKNLLSA